MKTIAYFSLIVIASGILLAGCEEELNPVEGSLLEQDKAGLEPNGISLMTGGGSIIAFQIGPQDGNKDVYVMNPYGSDQVRLTFQEGHDGYPSLSPNGKKIAFESDRDGNLEIYAMNIDGSEQTRLTNTDAFETDPDWSPDGKTILFGRKRDGSYEICTMKADGSDQTLVFYTVSTNFPAPVWSPNGKQIAFHSDFEGNFEIYAMNADGTAITRLTNIGDRDEHASWSPNGKKIAFISNRDGNREVYVMYADGSEQTRLTYTPGREISNPTWSPDGKKIAFDSERDGNFEIYIMNEDGSEQINVSNNSASRDIAPDWGHGSMERIEGPGLVDDIDFVNPEFSALVFYRNITGPDGIVPLADKKLLVINECEDPGPGVFSAREGDAFSVEDAFSTIGLPFDSPDDMTMGQGNEVYIADGQAQTVFTLAKQGGVPVEFVTPSTTGSGSFNPFGVAIAPENFDGPNVDPGDLIIADNAYGNVDRAVWAVNPTTGVAQILAQGDAFDDGPITVAFNSDGTLYIFENNHLSGTGRIVTLSADGAVSPFLTGIGATGSLAIHPVTDELFFKQEEGQIWRIPKTGGTPLLFASNVGEFQDMEFDKHGTALYVSVRTRHQVIQICADKKDW